MRLLITLVFFSTQILAFDEDVLSEIQNINQTKTRYCESNGVEITINAGTLTIKDSNKLFGKHKSYNVYDESADYILADHLTTTNLDYAENNFFPEVIILKKGKKVFLMEGLSFKFQKNGFNENCKGSKVSNLHCYSKAYNTNISSFKKKITLAFQNNKIRDLASINKFKEITFPYDQFDFHSSQVVVGNNGPVGRSVAIIDGGEIINFTYSHPKGKRVLNECNLTL